MRAIFAVWFVVLGVTVAFAEGDYQRTKDGKTIVWNSEPNTGDEAVWTGDRDGEAFASGSGTLTWYTSGKVYGRYFGNMVKGRFDGAVNVHSNGKTAHAMFDHGKRTTRWVPGAAPSRPEPQMARGQEPPATNVVKEEPVRKAVAVKGTPEPASSPVEKPEAPAAGPPMAKPSQTPRPLSEETLRPVAKTKAASTPATPKLSVLPRATPKEIAASDIEPPLLTTPSSSSAPSNLRIEPPIAENSPTISETVPARPSVSSTKLPNQSLNSGPAANAKAKMDASLRALVRPPSSLNTNAIPEPSVSTSAAPVLPQVGSTPNAGASLTQDEAIALADDEARNRGFDLNEFQRPKANYSATERKWSLFYDQKSGNGIPEIGKYFAATVDDATKKAVIQK